MYSFFFKLVNKSLNLKSKKLLRFSYLTQPNPTPAHSSYSSLNLLLLTSCQVKYRNN